MAKKPPESVGAVRAGGIALMVIGLCLLVVPPLGAIVIVIGLCGVVRAPKIYEEAVNDAVNAAKPAVPAAPSDWEVWDASVHLTDGQAGRMQRALTQEMKVLEPDKSGRYRVVGSTGKIYATDFQSCTCDDFGRRHIPCKHMYLLAREKAGFDPIPYIIRSNVEPHPLRGYMNMGRYKIRGKNPETGRVNTRTVYAVDEAEAARAAKPFKFLEPLKIEEVAYDEASDFEQNEAREIGVYVPAGAKGPDVVASVQRYKNIDEATIYRSEWEYAASVGIRLSALDGVTRAKILFREAHKRWRNHAQLSQ